MNFNSPEWNTRLNSDPTSPIHKQRMRRILGVMWMGSGYYNNKRTKTHMQNSLFYLFNKVILLHFWAKTLFCDLIWIMWESVGVKIFRYWGSNGSGTSWVLWFTSGRIFRMWKNQLSEINRQWRGVYITNVT